MSPQLSPHPGPDGAASVRRDVGWASVGFAVAAVVVGGVIAPPDHIQGDAARLMYLHVPAAWTAYLSFAVVLVASVRYLRTRDPRWDRYGRIAAEIGVAMTVLTIAVGSVWGRLVWGVWWAWDPRLVSTAVLLLVYAGYLAVRGLDNGARPAAVVGIAGVAVIPVVHFSVVWWRSLHQPATLLAPNVHPPIDAVMAAALALAVLAFTSAATWIFLRRNVVLSGLQELEVAPAGAGR